MFILALWHINHCGLLNAKSFLYIYIKYIGIGLIRFYGILSIVGYLMPNSLYPHILNIYDLVGLGWVGFYGILTLFNGKFSLSTYIKYM